ncbi:MAG: RNA polymerase sigma factor [Flavobacteriaceae bacterium]|nr:RNA polymerase sigma factor [Flavobacteriaceae bacterium]
MSNELERITQLQNGDQRALSSLYDSYSGALYGVIIRMCRDEGQAQDLLQETFVKIWQNSKSYDPEKGKFYTWAYRIARNTTLNFLRKGNQLIQTDDLSVYSNKAEEGENNIDSLALIGTIKKLESHHQKALELVYFQGLTHREAHKEMDVPLGTFKSYVQQALKKLRELYPPLALVMALLIERML